MDFIFNSIRALESAYESFRISIAFNIVCLVCNASSARENDELFFSLALEVGNRTDLTDLLDKYFEDELLTDYNCSCGQNLSALAKRITNLPPVIAIQVKRYDRDSVKSSDVVVPNINLDFTKYTDTNSVYQLRSIISHKGTSIDTGHYTCTIYERVDSDRGFYFEVDGTSVSCKENVDYVNTDGYIFFYENEVCVNNISSWIPCSFLLLIFNTKLSVV